METIISTNLLATVKLIPLFNYLNMLSDFLFTENYLAEVNQNKQIPVVNALYEYLEVYRDDQPKKVILIRKLLQGSDLYGEQDGENLEPIFVNAMFDYIISSLVFDKYGNIYGFLADSIRRSKKLQFDYVMRDIKEKLKNATFQNEYGANSVLTDLAVNKIYNDIILSYLPQPETNISILSLDYIFAQAGSTYLRLGRINNTYYSDSKIKKFQDFNKTDLFAEYLIIGHTVGKLLKHKKIDPSNVKVFALSALCYYLLIEKETINKTITNVIFEPSHWKKAFQIFLKYVDNVFDQLDNQLKKDNSYKMHLALLHFQNRASMARNVSHSKCKFLNKEDEENVFAIVQHAEDLKCNRGNVLTNINDLFEQEISEVSKIYRQYELESTQKDLEKFLERDLQGVNIKLLLPYQEESDVDFNNSQHLLYDLLQFFFTVNKTFDYYALLRENYTFTFLKESDNPQLFQQTLGSSLEEIKKLKTRAVILKFPTQDVDAFFDELLNYKTEQFKFYLNNFTDNLGKKKWWLEFGLALVPSYPCLFNNNDSRLCEINEIKFLNNFQEDLSLYITNKLTRTLLSDCGTTIKTLVLRYSISETIDSIVTTFNKSTLFPKTETPLSDICDKITSGIEEIDFEHSFVTTKEAKFITKVIDYLSEKTDYHFRYVNHVLKKMYFLEYSFFRKVGVVGKTKKAILYVNNYHNNNTGYGYKFIITYTYNNQINIAQLRTIYDFKDKIFISLYQNLSNQVNKYIKLNNESLEYEIDYFIYEVNYKIRRKSTRLLFSVISIFNDNNDKCDDDTFSEGLKYSSICRRYSRFVEKTQIENEVIHIMKNNTFVVWKNMSEEQIRYSLKKYTLPEDKTFLVHFINHLINDANFEKSEWSKNLIIDNSDLLNKLRYEIRLENDDVSIADGGRRINNIYTSRERRKIEEGTSIENIINDYNKQKASYSVTFEDYYAIRNFATTGDTRITGDTNEAKLMKLALYKLAIRQSDDLDQEFDLKLFRLECKPIGTIINELYVGKHITLQKFMFTSTNVESATRFAAYPASGFRNVLYVIEFFGPYFRAKIQMKVDQFEALVEKKVVLLPGNEFIIKRISIFKMGGLGNALKVVLSSKSQNTEKYEWYRNIMREIERIEV